MANIHKRISSNSTSRSEKALFDTAACLKDEWDVWMNVHLNLENKKTEVSEDHEVDCILYHKKYGMLLIECKDNHISTEEAPGTEEGCIWRQGKDILPRSPKKQVQINTHLLHDHFSEKFPGPGRNIHYRVRVQWAVCFGDMESMEKIGSNAIQPKRIFFKSDLKSYNTLERKVKKILETKEDSYGNQPFPNDELPEDYYNELVKFLGGFDEPTWPELWEIENNARLQPTETQEMLMESICRNPRMRIEGVAGSGKSVLVQWEAARLAGEGKRIVVLCYNDLLADQMQEHFKEKGFDDNQIVANSFHRLACKYVHAAKVAGVPKHEPADPAARSEYYENVLMHLGEAIRTLRAKNNKLFDALIIDEGQDFENRWVDLALQLLNDPKKGTVRFFYDPNQTIYKNRAVLGNRTINEMPVMVLRRGYRSTKKILEWVRETTDININCYDNTPTGRPVDVRMYTNPEEQEELLRKEIERLKKKGVGPEDILVVSLHSRAHSALANLDNDQFKWSDISDSLNSLAINIVSVYRYKGLDKRVVILTDLEPSKNGPGFPHSNANLIMVGATRAKEHLVVFKQRHGA